MKWALQQLARYNGKEFPVNGTIDVSSKLNDSIDVVRISEVMVNGFGIEIGDDAYEFDLHIKCTCVLEDANTLEELDYPIEMDVTEVFSKTALGEEDEVYIIEGQTIDLSDAIWQDIYLEIPMRVTKEDLENK